MGNTTILLGGKTPSFHNDLDCVLKLAGDALFTFKRDAEIHPDCMDLCLASKGSLDRVRRFFEVIYADDS